MSTPSDPVNFDRASAEKIAEVVRLVMKTPGVRFNENSPKDRQVQGIHGQAFYIRIVSVDQWPVVNVRGVSWSEAQSRWVDTQWGGKYVVMGTGGVPIAQRGVYRVRSQWITAGGEPMLWAEPPQSGIYAIDSATEIDTARWEYTAVEMFAPAQIPPGATNADPVKAYNLPEFSSLASRIGNLASDPNATVLPVSVGMRVSGQVTFEDDPTSGLVPVVLFSAYNPISYTCPDGGAQP